MMRINPKWLSQEALDGLIKGYVFQVEGSDYEPEPLEDRVLAAKSMLERGELILLYSSLNESAFIVTKAECIERFKAVPDYICVE